jgi:D-alanine-D-alanine ligase
MFEILDVPYVGAGVLASAACMDKVVFKELMAQAGVPQVEYVLMREGDDPAPVARLGFPCWVKPARLGSSVGIVPVAQESELEPALQTAFAHDPRVIVEAGATGIEVECAVLGHTLEAQASTPGEIVLRRGAGWYDYEAKYEPGGMELEVPARISAQATARLRELAVAAFAAAGCSGLARADFFVDGEDVLVNELNTMPGFTATSVYGKLWAATGLEYGDLVTRLCEIGIERSERERAYRF